MHHLAGLVQHSDHIRVDEVAILIAFVLDAEERREFQHIIRLPGEKHPGRWIEAHPGAVRAEDSWYIPCWIKGDQHEANVGAEFWRQCCFNELHETDDDCA